MVPINLVTTFSQEVILHIGHQVRKIYCLWINFWESLVSARLLAVLETLQANIHRHYSTSFTLISEYTFSLNPFKKICSLPVKDMWQHIPTYTYICVHKILLQFLLMLLLLALGWLLCFCMFILLDFFVSVVAFVVHLFCMLHTLTNGTNTWHIVIVVVVAVVVVVVVVRTIVLYLYCCYCVAAA